jgi:hypothetical protein
VSAIKGARRSARFGSAGLAGKSVVKCNDAVLFGCLPAWVGSMAKRIETKWNRIGRDLLALADRDTFWNRSRINERCLMKSLVVASLGWLVFTVTPVYCQTPSAPPAVSAKAAPAAATKRADCRAAALSVRSEKQDKVDQYQGCLLQARMDCLKEAIAKKIVSDARRDYIKTCVGSRDDDNSL